MKAISKVLWIQNDLFAKWYVRDGEEYAGEKGEVEIEKEGYLHGKKIIEDDVGEGAEKEGNEERVSENGVCPFSGMVEKVATLAIEKET